MELVVKMDTEAAQKIYDSFNGFMARKAVGRTLKRTVIHMRSLAVRLIKNESYLKAAAIRESITNYEYDFVPDSGYCIGYWGDVDLSAGFSVASRKIPFDSFKLVPNRITARKKKRPDEWPLPGYKIGPREPVRLAPLQDGMSRPFVAKIQGKKGMFYRDGKNLVHAKGISVQYFSAFERIHNPVLESAKAFFLQRLEHEMEYASTEK